MRARSGTGNVLHFDERPGRVRAILVRLSWALQAPTLRPKPPTSPWSKGVWTSLPPCQPASRPPEGEVCSPSCISCIHTDELLDERLKKDGVLPCWIKMAQFKLVTPRVHPPALSFNPQHVTICTSRATLGTGQSEEDQSTSHSGSL